MRFWILFLTLGLSTLGAWGCAPSSPTEPDAPLPSPSASARAASEVSLTEEHSASPTKESPTAPGPSPSSSAPSKPSSFDKNQLSLGRNTYQAGELIEIRFQATTEAQSDAWVGLVPAEIPHGEAPLNDIFDLAYAPLGGNTSGILEFVAPDLGGDYEVRLFSSEAGKELSSVAFEVNAPHIPLSGNQIRLSKAVFAPGDTIELEVSILAADKRDDTAWVGLLPAAVEHGSEALNDQHVMAYQYLGPYLAGKMTFKAPEQPGLYDFRLHDTDNTGREIVFTSFLVVG